MFKENFENKYFELFSWTKSRVDWKAAGLLHMLSNDLFMPGKDSPGWRRTDPGESIAVKVRPTFSVKSTLWDHPYITSEKILNFITPPPNINIKYRDF